MLGTDQIKDFDQTNNMLDKASKAIFDYWLIYSNLSTWQFWVMLSLLVLPLIVLYLYMDRKYALLLGFFGLNIHVWFLYIDTFGTMNKLWNYPFKVIPFLPSSITLDTSLVPVSFMLLYQWVLKKNKNYYLYSIGLALFMSFLFKPAFTHYGLFRLYKGSNYFYLFLIYITVALVSKWITNLFLHFQKEGEALQTIQNFKLKLSGLFSKERAK